MRQRVTRVYSRLRARYLLARVRGKLGLPARWPDAVIVACMVVCTPLAGWVAYESSRDAGYLALAQQARPQLDLFTAGLDAEVRRYDQLANLVQTSSTVHDALRDARGTGAAARLNETLTRFAQASAARTIRALDRQGVCIAASDWYVPSSSVGHSFAETELFRKALQEGQSALFGPLGGAGQDHVGYHYAQLVREGGQVIGLVVIQGTVEQVDAVQLTQNEPGRYDRLLLVDDNDVIVLSTSDELRMRTLRPLTIAQRETLRESGRYREPLEMFRPLTTVAVQTTTAGPLMRVPFRGEGSPMLRVLQQERPLTKPRGRAVLLSDASAVNTDALRNAAGAGGAVLLAGVLLLYALQSRREVLARQAARAMLQRAHDELGLRVEERTSELRLINHELMREIRERQNAEAVLRTAQEELIQAGKLALLGQMAAGVAHEVNQPLMAMRALADNAAILLQRGDPLSALKNLESISALTERLGGISSQLKSFSRKAPLHTSRIPMETVLAGALALLDNRIRRERIQVKAQLPLILIECDLVRLEQVIINIVTNAMDAMKPQTSARIIEATAWTANARAILRITDSGPGIPADLSARLFEPFFTTKPQGEGLGLGLTISASIVSELGGTLRFVPVPQGAAFEIELRAAQADTA